MRAPPLLVVFSLLAGTTGRRPVARVFNDVQFNVILLLFIIYYIIIYYYSHYYRFP